jgi:ABC-type multidrug transport system fused ATPase/permease subunit
MFKTMLKPGLTAGIIGAVVSTLFGVLIILTFLIGPVALVISSISPLVSLVLDLGYGFLAARLAQAKSQEKLRANEGAIAGLIAGVVSTVIGLAASPAIQALQNALVTKERIIAMTIEWYRSMGAPQQQLDTMQAQIAAQQASSSTMAMGIAVAAVCAIVGIAVCTGGGALGVLVFKPKLRKLVCDKCQAAFELGANAFVEVREGSPDLVDYCNWEDLAPDVAKQQRATVAEVLKTKGAGRQWQCGMCKTAQAY